MKVYLQDSNTFVTLTLPTKGVDTAQKEQTATNSIEPQETPEFVLEMTVNGTLAAVTDSVTVLARLSGGTYKDDELPAPKSDTTKDTDDGEGESTTPVFASFVFNLVVSLFL